MMIEIVNKLPVFWPKWMCKDTSSIEIPLRLGRGFKASHHLHLFCNWQTMGVKTHIPWLCSHCWKDLDAIVPAVGSPFPEEGIGEGSREELAERQWVGERTIAHSVKSLRKLDLFNCDPIAHIPGKGDKTENSSDRWCHKGQGQHITAWHILLGYSEKLFQEGSMVLEHVTNPKRFWMSAVGDF